MGVYARGRLEEDNDGYILQSTLSTSKTYTIAAQRTQGGNTTERLQALYVYGLVVTPEQPTRIHKLDPLGYSDLQLDREVWEMHL